MAEQKMNPGPGQPPKGMGQPNQGAGQNNRRAGGPPPRGMMMPGQKPDMKALKRAVAYLKNYKGRVALAVICIILNAIVSVISATAIGTLIDDYITPMAAAGQLDLPALLGYIGKLAVIFACGVLCVFGYSRIFAITAQRILKDIRNDMFAKMQKLPISYFDTHPVGDTMSHYTNDIDTLRQLLAQTLPGILTAVISIAATLITMLNTSIWLTLFVVVYVFVMTKVTMKIGMTAGKYFVAQQQKIGALNGYVEELVNGQRVVKVFNYEPRAIKEFTEKNEELFEAARNANAYGSIMGPVMNGSGHLEYVLIAVLGASLVALGVNNLTFGGFGLLTLGAVVSFLTLSRNFTMTVSNITQQISAVIMASAGAGRVFKLMDEQPEVDEGSVILVNAREKADGSLEECKERTHIWAWKSVDEKGQVKLTRLRGEVRFENVHFGYVPEKEILHDITLYAKPGQKVAFVGSTGAGKTTITNLINRFYDIQNGTITYDGLPIRSLKKDDLRSSLGMVLQDVNLFSGTIRDNIRYGKLDATNEEIEAAAKLANAHDFITRLPHGYDTEIDGDGSQLSQGQRQLLSIARAALEDPPVMILDEATSSIDTRTERLVQQGMDSLMKGRTVFVIAHRLSTVQDSNVIMVLEHGNIIERGTHEDLIAQKGKYYQLYTGAFELE